MFRVAVTVPDWADVLLDLIGVAWPNVDEDAYRDMADALREFADDLEDDGQLANNHVERLLSSGTGESIDALNSHWKTIKGKHLKDIASGARTIGGAMDMAAGAVEGMKGAALVQLGYLAAEAGIALSLIPVTGGLSALFGAAAMRATQEVVKRLIKECVEEAVGYIVAALTEPAVAALEGIAADLVVQLGSMAIGLQDEVDMGQAGKAGRDGFGQGVQSGKEAMHLASAGGGGAPGGGGSGLVDVHIEHGEHDRASTQLGNVSTGIHGKTTSKLGKARSHHGRTRGRDSIARAIDPVADKAMEALTKATKAMGDHVGKTLPKAVKHISTSQKNTDGDIRDRFNQLKASGAHDGKGGSGPGGPAGRGGPGAGSKDPASMRPAKDDPRGKGMPLDNRRCKTDPVDIASGEMVLAQTDLALHGVLPFVLRRTHISGYHYGRSFGSSWASTVDERLELNADAAGAAIWAREDGSLLVYPRLPRDAEDEPVLPLTGARLPLRLLEHNDFGDITYVVDDPLSGLTRRFTGNPYDGSALYWLHGIEDRNGNSIRFHREDDGRLISAAHDGGYRITCDSDPAGRVTAFALRTPDGPQTLHTFGYDGAGHLVTVAHADSPPLRFTYDESARITSWTDRRGATYRYVYDAAGRVVETIGPDGSLSSRLTYDTENRITRFTDSTGAVTVSHFNSLGQVVTETDPLGHSVHRQWDRYDNLLARTDELGRTATFTYDEQHNLTSLRSPDGTSSSAVYNAFCQPVELTGPDGTTWRQEYDERGNRTAVIAPDGAVVRFTYDGRGALLTRTDPAGRVERQTRDAAGLAVSRTDPLGNRFTVLRDAFARPIEAMDPQGAVTRTEWSPEGWALRRTAPDGTTECWTWDEEGNCTSHTGPAGAVTRFEYGPFDLLTARIGADGARYEFRHDTELRLTQVRNPQGLTWDYTYDAAGNLIAESDFDNRVAAYELDPAGQVVARTTPLGDRITTSYDANGRLTAKNVSGETTRYRYDAAGRIESAASSTSAIILERDLIGRLLSETVDGRTTSYTYDPTGQVTSRTSPTGAVTRFAYDEAGLRSTVSTGGHLLAFTRDARGRELTREFGPAEHPVTIGSAWDPAGRLAAQVLATPARTLRSRAFSYRPDGHLETVTDELDGTVRAFGLDPVGRPLRVTAQGWSESYAYDVAGNQISAEWPDRAQRTEGRGERTYEGTRLLSAGSVRCSYDAAGRTVVRRRKRLSSKADTWHYTWDAENRLTACRTPDGVLWTYAYDPLGRRTAKHRMAPDGQTIVVSVYFSWDGTRLAEQTDTAHGTTTSWEYDGHRPLTQLERRGTPQTGVDSRFFAIVTDLVGAPSELVDEDGKIAWQARSTVWGTTTWNRGAAAYTPLRFPGQYDDAETGLYYNCFRHYDPATARYASADPLGLAPAPNPVAYVINPQTWADPEGLIAKGCTEDGGWYSGMQPANLKKPDGSRVTDVDMEINHIPAKASYSHLDEPGFKTNKRGGGAGMGPSIRMEYDDHRAVTSTGSGADSVQWRADQRALIDSGRWDLAMKMDIDEIRDLYGDKYDTHIADMVESLKANKKFQDMLTKRGWSIDYDVLK
ncbi:RHS repeat-associated core domain-containing protein [Streptomyces sp. NPDC059957]|uniref:RHS repeat-associated core domain-containing protein n=3 Tax=unclassified Streptomyces TaxID=2593676 RepID=UPI0036610C2D